jgi:hypothetical protein
MNLHIYTSPMQPLTKYVDHTFDPPWECSTPGGRLVYCECCRKRRFARDVVIQCYYDGARLWCAPGRGCNNPKLAEAKRRREFKNRSRGQKRRWARKGHNA